MRGDLLDTATKAETKFFVCMSAYPGEFFIFVDPEYRYEDKLEEVKLRIRMGRSDGNDAARQRYSSAEVALFMERAREWL